MVQLPSMYHPQHLPQVNHPAHNLKKSKMSHRKHRKLNNKTIQYKPVKNVKSRKAIQPDRKMYIVSSASKHRDSSSKSRHPSISKRRLSNERMFSKRLFQNRERTLGGAGTLATHGLQNRKSRLGPNSRSGTRNRNISESESQNNTMTLFPTIGDGKFHHPNFGMTNICDF